MDFKKMQRNLKMHKYRSVDDLEQDMFTLCKNAQTYNVEGSLVSFTAHCFPDESYLLRWRIDIELYNLSFQLSSDYFITTYLRTNPFEQTVSL